MALDMSKYAKMTKVERKLPIIFVINEKRLGSNKWGGGAFKSAIADIMRNLSHRSVDAVMSVVSFGDEVHLWSGFTEYDNYTDEEWPETKDAGKSLFNVALTLVKDMLEDIDTTPDGNYDPIVVLISSDEVTPGYINALEAFKEDGRFKDIQTIGISDLWYDGHRYRVNSPEYEINVHAPKILKEFAGENVAVYIEDYDYSSWCTSSSSGRTETTAEYSENTWFCPVLNMMELRYTEDGQQHASRVCQSSKNCGGFQLL